MAADAALVQASFKEAMANVPMYDKEITKQKANIVKSYTDPILTALQQKDLDNKAKNKKQNDLKAAEIGEFTTIADDINKRLSTYERGGKEAGMHEQIYNNTFDYIEELKTEFEKYNTIGEDDTIANKKKRTEILGKLQSANAAVIDLRTSVLRIGKLAGSEDGGNNMSETGMSRSDIAITKEILNMDGDYSNVKQRWDKKTGEVVFDVTISDDVFKTLPLEEQKLGQTRSWTTRDLNESFKLKPIEKEAALLQTRNNIKTNATKAKWNTPPGNLQNAADSIAKTIEGNKADASHIFTNRQDGQPSQGYGAPGGTTGKWKLGSWANALEAHPDLNATRNIVTGLVENEELNLSDVDGADGSKKDNKISIEEARIAIMDGENRDLAIDALVNHKNPLYDHNLSVQEFSLWRATQDQAIFKANLPAKPSGIESTTLTGTAPLFTPNTWIKLGGEDKSISAADAGGIVDAIKTGTSFPFMGSQYDYVNGGWYENYEDGNNEKSDNYYGSPEMLRLNVLKTTDKRFTNLTTKKENKVDAGTGNTVSETPAKTLETSFEDFQQDEYDFTKNIKFKYDLSNFRVQDTRTKLQEDLGFGETPLNHISIYDLKGNLVYTTRTNFSNSKKAANAAKDFNKFLINNNIQLKDPTTGMTATEKIKYYIDNPTK